MPELNPLTNEQIFLKKIAENTGSNYNTGDVSEINPLTIDQIMLKEIAANTAGQSGDITELEGKVADNTAAIGATQDMISDAYDSTQTYNVGDYCIHENILYKCNTAIATPEAFTPAKWTATNVTSALYRGSVSVTADGVKTYQVLLHELFTLSSKNIIIQYRDTIKLVFSNMVARYSYNNNMDDKCFFSMTAYSNTIEIFGITLSGTLADVKWGYWDGSSYNDMSQLVPPAGDVLRLEY